MKQGPEGDRSTSVRVELGARGYDILVGANLLVEAHRLIVPHLLSLRAVIVSDAALADLYARPLEALLQKQGVSAACVTVPSGEGSKSFAGLEALIDQLLALQTDRKTALIALGGGVIGDLAGFAASVLLRGVPLIQIPTTLLAQVDSSVGGKTAINTAAGKNLVGSFYQPQLVIADLATLETLPPRERRAGYAEIIKYGLIMAPDFYSWCLANAGKILENDVAALTHAVTACCRYKAEIVSADEREAGKRALLNFGHTFGHALEAETGMGSKLLHGEAVAIGMVMACRLSREMGLTGDETERELAAHLSAIGLPASPKAIAHAWDAGRIAAHFAGDKKAEGGRLTFVVLDGVGKARVVNGVDPALAERVVASFLAEG